MFFEYVLGEHLLEAIRNGVNLYSAPAGLVIDFAVSPRFTAKIVLPTMLSRSASPVSTVIATPLSRCKPGIDGRLGRNGVARPLRAAAAALAGTRRCSHEAFAVPEARDIGDLSRVPSLLTGTPTGR